MTTFGRPGYLRAAMTAGASGFLLKDAPAAELAEAIRRVAPGERVVDPALAAAALAEGDSPLTNRETDVLTAAAGHDAHQRDRRPAAPVAGHRAQSPVGCHAEARCAQPGRGGPDRPAQGLAVAGRVAEAGAVPATGR